MEYHQETKIIAYFCRVGIQHTNLLLFINEKGRHTKSTLEAGPFLNQFCCSHCLLEDNGNAVEISGLSYLPGIHCKPYSHILWLKQQDGQRGQNKGRLFLFWGCLMNT